MYRVQGTGYSGQWTVDSVRCKVYRIHCTVYGIYRVQCTVYIVQCSVYREHCTVYSLQSTVHNVQSIDYTMYRERGQWSGGEGRGGEEGCPSQAKPRALQKVEKLNANRCPVLGHSTLHSTYIGV